MRSYFLNVPTLILGLLTGALLPISQWYVATNPVLDHVKLGNSQIPNNVIVQEASALMIPHPPVKSLKMLSPKVAKNNPKDDLSFLDLDKILNTPFDSSTTQPSVRDISVIEFSRPEGMEKILQTVFDWQRQNPGKKRDLVIYLAPTNGAQNQEQLMAETIKKYLRENPQKLPTQGKTAFILHSRERFNGYSLNKLLSRARQASGEPFPGLFSQAVGGSINRICWIRTTISRWKLMPKDGLNVDGQIIPMDKVSAFLVDPNRKLITDINLAAKNTFSLLAKFPN